eukprot:3184597-Rhodomonas_salina.2
MGALALGLKQTQPIPGTAAPQVLALRAHRLRWQLLHTEPRSAGSQSESRRVGSVGPSSDDKRFSREDRAGKGMGRWRRLYHDLARKRDVPALWVERTARTGRMRKKSGWRERKQLR